MITALVLDKSTKEWTHEFPTRRYEDPVDRTRAKHRVGGGVWWLGLHQVHMYDHLRTISTHEILYFPIVGSGFRNMRYPQKRYRSSQFTLQWS